MVSKITLFEPHLDDAQIGPASLATDWPGPRGKESDVELTGNESDVEHESPASESSAFRRRPSARTVIAIASLAGGLMAGFLAWRRFRSGSKSSSDDTAAAADEPVIEERPIEDIPSE